MPERNFYQCDEQSARSGDIDIEEHPAVSILTRGLSRGWGRRGEAESI